ncbi:CRISPR-associated endonuclease Cas2 [Streptomyces chiangmaiensis]|uniref:CRISPR-associated endoribonuclease Cas2 n=1 Tax=Streptomyces chiangmaiensis TaxID=766497 RepID=A0ABU7FN14_9ACTN|nr:CRISPR-associated endonuclease Cas2 [Streptomyces chiangmaiensis]MED7825492.1 CRISPR-associated endonuclease Cas2 [Streptomyces chiangmaiensis]
MAYTLLVSYDIGDDDRRAEISDLLASHGARVQYSVFEVTLPTKKTIQQLRSALRKLIDRDEDQVRLYPLPATTLNELVILGNRRLEERADFWIV